MRVYENQIDFLNSMHKDCGPEWDWSEVVRGQPPAAPVHLHAFEAEVRGLAARTMRPPPQRSHVYEERARAELADYRASFFERLLGSDKKRLAQLEHGILEGQFLDANAFSAAQAEHSTLVARYERDLAEAKRRDDEVSAAAQAEHAQLLARFNWEQQVGAGILRGDLRAYRAVIDHLSPFEELVESGMDVSVDVLRSDVAVLRCLVEDDSIVPKEKKELTAAGKLTSKKIAVGTYWSIYQDYVCGCALRAAREVFALLPLPRVVINVSIGAVDTATGHRVQNTILAVGISREIAKELRYESLDPSDSLSNFDHRMKFKKATGFEPVDPISADESFISTKARRQ